MNLLSVAQNTVTKTIFNTKKHSPLMLTGIAVAGVVGTTYLTWHATKKLETVLAEHEEKAKNGEELTSIEKAKDIASVVALPVLTGVLTVSAFVASYCIQNKRIAAIASTLSLAIANNEKYKAKVIEVVGEATAKQIETEVIKDDIKKMKVAEEAKDKGETFNESDLRLEKSIGAYYEQSSEYVRDDYNYNIEQIRLVQKKVDHIVGSRGYILLNEVYDLLGFKRTKFGAMTGWTVGKTPAIDWQPINMFESDSGEYFEPSIWVSWATPTYIYDQVEFSGHYSVIE